MRMKKYLFIGLALSLSLGCSLLNNSGKALPTAQVRELIPTTVAQPTFTPTPPLLAMVTPIPPTDTPVSTVTPVPVEPTIAPTATPLPQPTQPSAPQATITGASVNVRSGPGTAYPRVGQVSGGYTGEIKGRNNDASWLFIAYPGGEGWVYSNLTQIQGDVNSLGVVQAPPPPPKPTSPPPQAAPTATPVPQAKYQYTITNIFAKTNKGLTQIKGIIRDKAGNPVNGMRVRVRSGSFCTISFPSGPWKDLNGNPSGYNNGEYDIYLASNERPGTWRVNIVADKADNDTDACRNMPSPSETKEVETKIDATIVHVEWVKNW